MRLPRLLRFAAHQPPFLDLSLCFQQWLASTSRHLCQINKKGVLLNVQRASPGALRPRKCSAAAVVARADPTSQVQPTCLASRRKTCRDSQTFNPHHSTLFQVFVKLPCPCQVRCPGNLERGFMKKLINTHTVILQKHEELLARSAIDKKFYT